MESNQTNKPRFLFLRASLVFARQKLEKVPLNVGRMLSDHLVGKKHTPAHHVGVSFFLMTIGVLVAQLGAIIDMYVFHIMFDLLGYLIHGAAGYPIVEFFIKLSQDE